MSDLDLDISNYTIKDIERFFKLSPTVQYSASDIELRECEIREQLLKSGHVNKRTKRDLMEFLTTAKNWLTTVKCKIVAPTSLPKITSLDQTPARTSVDQPYTDNLIERPKTQYMNTQNSEYFPGIMNPLTTRVITKCLTIDTRFRDNYFNTQSSDITIQLPTKLTKIVSMQLSSLELPITFYAISETMGNSFIYLEATYTPVGGTDTYTDPFVVLIPDGNYNANDLITTINQILSPTDADGVLYYPDSPFSYIQFTLDITTTGSGTGKVYVQPSGAKADMISNIKLDFSVDINGAIDNVDLSTKLGWNLGYRKRMYTDGTYHISDTVIEPSSMRYFYLAIDDFNNSVNNHFIAAFNSYILSPNILARISLKGSFFNMIMEKDYTIVTEPRKYFGPVDIQRLRIQILDDRGRVISMNSADYSFCLVFKQLYDI
jgi:hypothetical protein